MFMSQNNLVNIHLKDPVKDESFINGSIVDGFISIKYETLCISKISISLGVYK